MKKYIKLTINSNEYELLVADNETLAQLLRGPQVNSARRQQGLLHLYKKWCTQWRCR